MKRGAPYKREMGFRTVSIDHPEGVLRMKCVMGNVFKYDDDQGRSFRRVFDDHRMQILAINFMDYSAVLIGDRHHYLVWPLTGEWRVCRKCPRPNLIYDGDRRVNLGGRGTIGRQVNIDDCHIHIDGLQNEFLHVHVN